ncbi:MAG: xanthine dehydrogenase family protein molybdopterin-binding subunit [bacterium]|nr:xanthine dehydrogenase family protein molybdopterin-binding subunit [bacterium]
MVDKNHRSDPLRVDAREKVTGQATYTGDLCIPDMLTARVLRSPLPRARIRSIDVSAAASLPGVAGVLTGDDLREMDPYFGVAMKDQPILAIDVVRHEGEPVAAVVAKDPAVAEAALNLIDVDYEEEDPILDPVEAMKEDAPIVHETMRPSVLFSDIHTLRFRPGTNICHHYHYDKGDVEKGFEEADLVLEDTFRLPAIHAVPLEPFISIAQVQSGEVTIWSSTQHPFPVQKDIALLFGLPVNAVRVIVPYIGGSFGSKAYSKAEPLAVALAWKVGKPVKVELSMEEMFRSITRHPAVVKSRVGVRGDGTLVAKKVEIIIDTGAYADTGPRVANKAGYRAPGPYRIPHLWVDCYAVYTNNIPSGSYRGFGAPQVGWACESQMDMIAEQLALDPVEIRKKNLLNRGDIYVPGKRPLDCDVHEILGRALDLVGWDAPLKSSPGKRRGRGIAMGFKDGGGSQTVSQASIRLHADGCATVLMGSVEVGQGAFTVMRIIAAKELGLPLEKVRLSPPDTAISPYDQATSMSRTTVSMGQAVKRACDNVRSALAKAAGDLWDMPLEKITVADGQVFRDGEGHSYGEVIEAYFGMPVGELGGDGMVRMEDEGGVVGDRSFWEISVGAAEVEVDESTGAIEVCRYASVIDAGYAIHRELVETQDEGASMQGIGAALFEEMVVEDGQLINPNLIDYRVPTFEDLPKEFRSDILEQGGGPGPYGAKGVSESGNIAASPAIANALAQATGVRIKELPLSPERVWLALQAKKKQDNGDS